MKTGVGCCLGVNAIFSEKRGQLSPDEIFTMLEDYVTEREVKMDARVMADRIFYYTSGYPFLVSYLCKITDTIFAAWV